jgi:hypothetical protein
VKELMLKAKGISDEVSCQTAKYGHTFYAEIVLTIAFKESISATSVIPESNTNLD